MCSYHFLIMFFFWFSCISYCFLWRFSSFPIVFVLFSDFALVFPIAVLWFSCKSYHVWLCSFVFFVFRIVCYTCTCFLVFPVSYCCLVVLFLFLIVFLCYLCISDNFLIAFLWLSCISYCCSCISCSFLIAFLRISCISNCFLLVFLYFLWYFL